MTLADITKTHLAEAANKALLLSTLVFIHSRHVGVGRGEGKVERMRFPCSQRSLPPGLIELLKN